MQSKTRPVRPSAPANHQVFEGEVTTIHGRGKGRFVSTKLRQESAGLAKGLHVTFSMRDWKGSEPPRLGQVVLLENLNLFRGGWRALSARPVTLNTMRQDWRERGEQ